MGFDVTMKVVMAIAGVVGGIAQTCINGKTLYNMAKGTETENQNPQNSDTQNKEV